MLVNKKKPITVTICCVTSHAPPTRSGNFAGSERLFGKGHSELFGINKEHFFSTIMMIRIES
jgi:hypothetical protein